MGGRDGIYVEAGGGSPGAGRRGGRRRRPEAGPAFVEGGEGRRRMAGEPAPEPDGCREGGVGTEGGA